MTSARLGTISPSVPGKGTRRGALGRNPLVRIVIPLIPIAVLIGIWWLVALQLGRPRIYPTPDIVFGHLVTILQGTGQTAGAYDHIAWTMFRLAAAFAISFVLGSLIGILAGRVKFVFALIENLVWVFMAVPSVVWVFIFAVAMGITNVVPIAAVAALLTPMILVNVAEGAKSVPKDLVEMAESYKVTARQRLTDIYIPFLVPYLASSARTAFALGIKLIIVAEFVGLGVGIGFEVSYWNQALFMGPIIAWGIVMIVIGLAVDYLVFGPIERRVSRWKGAPRTETAVGGLG
jgi:ABC-type nitrate/sulfonate/bicarbonate transport system permease component